MTTLLTRNHDTRSRGALPLMAALLGVALAGCGDGDDGPTDATPGPAYLVGTRVFNDTTTTSFFHVVSSLEDGTAIDPGQALEAPGPAKLYAVPDIGWFGVGGGEAPTITRYTLDDAGALVAGDPISLSLYGVDFLWDTLYIVSATKAYYPDRARTQLIVWNPTEMRVTGTIPLPQTARGDHLALYGYAPIFRGKTLLITVGWFDWNVTDTVLGETGLVRIDTDTDTVLGFETDARCGGITQPVTMASGDTYLVSSALAGAAHRLGRLPTQPCALRIRAGETAFDAGYLGDLDALTGSAVSGEPIPAGSAGVFLRVLDEGLATIGQDSATWEITGQSAWRWMRWDVATDNVSAISTLEPSTSDVLWFQVDGHVYGSATKTDYSETTLIDLTAAGGPKKAITAPGFLHGVAKIR